MKSPRDFLVHSPKMLLQISAFGATALQEYEL